MNIYTFRAIIEPDENNTFHGYIPSLPGCHTWGSSLKETKKSLKEATKCHVQGLLIDKERIPREEDNLEIVQTFTEQELALGC